VGVARTLAAASLGALLLSVPTVGAQPRALPRATADRADDVSGPQIHALYVLPADGPDRGLDTDGTVAASVANWQRWFESQTLGGGLRLDTSGGELDVSFLRLSQSESALAGRGLGLRDAIEAELHAAGFERSGRVYAVYYDGGTTAACGGGAWPPALQGNVAALYLRATYGAGLSCYDPALSRSGLQIMDFAMLHEILHTMGFVPTCAPHHTRSGHVSDDPRDLMYAGDEPWRPSVLDVGQDDYYHAHILECRELAVSPYLERNVEHPKVALSVAVSGPGKVASARAGVRCKPRCRVTVDKGSTVVLRATPATGARLVRWGGACKGSQRCRVVMGGARKVTALFRR
jgi:List-Bact-rpt repeat protein